MSDTAPRGFWSIWPIRFIVLFVLVTLCYASGPLIAHVFKDQLSTYPKTGVLVVADVFSIALTVVAYCLLIRLTERRWPAELGAARAVPHVLQGALIGLALFIIVYLVFFAMHVATFKGLGSTQGLAYALMLSLTSGICEEIIFRGVVFRILEGAMGTLVALVLSAAFFGLVHRGNPGATLLSSIAIAVEAGILLGAAYALTRSLWLAIGLHFAWNFTEGGIFGAQVSGGKVTGLLNIPLSGPDIMTGGAFGPEASIVAMIVCTAAGLIMLGLAIRKGEWKPMHFRLRTAG